MDTTQKAEFETLLRQWLDMMYKVALRLTREKNDAEDLVEEAAILAWKNFEALKDRQKFKSWILKIMTNQYISQYRKAKSQPKKISNHPQGETSDDFSLFDQLVSPFLLLSYNPEKIFLDNLLKEDIITAIDTLPDDYRMAVILCELEDIPYQQAAKILRVPVGTVRSRLHRGKSLLQKSLWQYAKERGYKKV